MEHQPKNKKQRLSNSNNYDLPLNGYVNDRSQMGYGPNGAPFNGSPGMIIVGPSAQQPSTSYHTHPSNGQNPAICPSSDDQQPQKSVLQNLLLRTNPVGNPNGMRQQYSNNYVNRGNYGPDGTNNEVKMIPPPSSRVGMQTNGMPTHPPIRQPYGAPVYNTRPGPMQTQQMQWPMHQQQQSNQWHLQQGGQVHPNMQSNGQSRGPMVSNSNQQLGYAPAPPQMHQPMSSQGPVLDPRPMSSNSQPPTNFNGPPHHDVNRSQPLRTQDSEKRKLIQQQLVLLLHAHKCQQREHNEMGNQTPCTLPHCGTMKAVLNHMVHCNNGRTCAYPHCTSSRQIIAHWKNCSKDDCPVCKPLEKFSKSGTANPPSNIGPGSSHSESSLDAVGLLMDCNLPNNDPFRSNNPPNKIAPINGQNPAVFPTENFRNLPPPDPPSQGKEWHSSIGLDFRSHLVSKLVKAIFPSPDPSAIHDTRIHDLVSYARKVEKDMFENANDKEEYYHLLAEKIYKIQKELQEKKNRRLHEQGAGDNFRPPNQLGNQQPGMGMPNQQMGRQQLPSYNYSQYSSDVHMQQPMQMQYSQQPPQYPQDLMSIPPQSQPPMSTDPIGVQQVQFNPILHMKSEPVDVKQEPMQMRQEPVVKIETIDVTPELPPNLATRRLTPPVPMLVTAKAEHRDEAPVEEKVFDANELRSYLKPILDKLGRLEESLPFRVPVDVEVLQIAVEIERTMEFTGRFFQDYYEIIKKPMDMETIEKNLNRGTYKNPWEVCDDMWLMFENAWLYNRKPCKVYKYCTKLSEVFVECVNPVMRQMGFCCGQKLAFTPMALFCFGASTCIIARDQPYHLYDSGSSQYGVTVSDRYVYCAKCFAALPPEGINLSDNPSDPPNMASKEKFQSLKNDQIDLEPFEICKCCRRKWHRICALYSKKVFPEGFVCDGCRLKNTLPKPENKFTAKRLPHCRLSQYIENRVNTFVKNNNKSRGNYEVVIRVLCSTEKEVEVKPLMRAKYTSEGFPERFPYKTKAIFAFEVIDGVEVCFFGLHVQEYGSQCPPPNRRRVYIAYLDSVHFFQPRELRTDVYHEILLGYLQYVKNLGYTMAHIWAAPPSEGDDYIFHCHPPEQKIPKPKRLQDWYKRMLDKGRQEETVYEYKDILKQAKDDDLQSPTTLPYFEGDFWPNMIEDCIRDAEKEENERKRLEQSLAAAADEDEDDLYQTDDGVRLKKNNKSTKKKHNLKKLSKHKKKIAGGTGNEVTDKLFNLFEKHKEVFFTIRLVSQQAELSINNHEIEDPDALVSSELMDGRDTFLSKARDEHWEFSSMRRAKYSTLNFCHALHNQENKEIATYTCNNCGNNDGRWHCTVCEDYDLCGKCYVEIKHEHEMDKIQQLMEVDKSNESHNARNESVKKCIQSLVHACQCRDSNCRRATCMKMKRVVQHTKMCKRRQTTSCPVCKQLIALCCYHAKHCNLAQCHVPFCSNIRQKLQEQKRSQNRRAEMMMRRRIEKLHAAGGGGLQPAPSAAPSQPSTSHSANLDHGQKAKQMYAPQQHPNLPINNPNMRFEQPNQWNPGGVNFQPPPQHQMPQFHQQHPMHMQNQQYRMHMNQRPM